MKKRWGSIALSTVLTGSLLLSPMVNAEEMNSSKIVVEGNPQIHTQYEQETPEEKQLPGEEVKEENNQKPEDQIQGEEAKIEEDQEIQKEEVKEEDKQTQEDKKIEEKQQVKEEKKIEKFDKKNELGFLKGELSNKKGKDISGVIEFFEENKDMFGIENPNMDLQEISTKTDELGYTHIKVQQMYKDTPLFGKEYIIHFNKEGIIYAVNGKIDNELTQKMPRRMKRAADIGEEYAVQIAKSEVGIEKPIGEPEVKKYLYELDNDYVPVYEVKVGGLEPEPADWSIFVNATSGEIVKKYNRIANAAATGTGTGVLGDTKQINLDYKNGKYYMTDDTRNGTKIETYDASKIPQADWLLKYYLPGDLLYDTNNKLTEEKFKSAVDAHKYAGYVYDYYKNNFGRDSIDDRGMDIKSSVHYGKNYVNAFWFNNQMTYGDGDGQTSAPLSGALDVVAHEMTHGVTEKEANLVYENQSGALNESFSDVFGTLVEFQYQPDKADWLCGEDVWTPSQPGDALRDLENPGSNKAYSKQPSHMNEYENLPNTQDGDWGGVHTNSGIPNKAAYLVMSSIGTEKAGKIYYKALTNYLTSTSDFHDARLALIQSAEDFYGADSMESSAVANAFDSVGIE